MNRNILMKSHLLEKNSRIQKQGEIVLGSYDMEKAPQMRRLFL